MQTASALHVWIGRGALSLAADRAHRSSGVHAGKLDQPRLALEQAQAFYRPVSPRHLADPCTGLFFCAASRRAGRRCGWLSKCLHTLVRPTSGGSRGCACSVLAFSSCTCRALT